MGVVYRVYDLKRNVTLAMKVLHGELAEDPSVFKKFQREANALKKLTHPHIVPFYGIHRVPDDYAFLLERFIDGASLKSSVPGLNASPSTAIFFPFKFQRASSIFLTKCITWELFISSTSFNNLKGYPFFCEIRPVPANRLV